MGILSFGLVGIRQLAPEIPGPSLERLAEALADLVDCGLATHHNQDSDAGKQAYRTLAEETRSLYIDQSEAPSGSQHSPRSPGCRPSVWAPGWALRLRTRCSRAS
jgi:hypothetical protein